MHIAIKNKNLEIIKYLLNQKVTVDQVDMFGKTPLLEAILTRDKDLVLLLKTNGATSFGDPTFVTQLLLDAAKEGDLCLIKLFYHAGLKNLNLFVNELKRNIGHIAACERKIEII